MEGPHLFNALSVSGQLSVDHSRVCLRVSLVITALNMSAVVINKSEHQYTPFIVMTWIAKISHKCTAF